MRHATLGLTAAFVLVCGLLWPNQAAAQPYGYYGWWGPPPPPQPRLISVNGQYYDFTASGLMQMCQAEPALCVSPRQQAMMSAIKRDETLGWTFALGGIGAGVAGAVVLVTAPCSVNGDCVSNARGITGASLLFGSLAFELAAAFLWPSTSELMRLVNDINRGHAEDPPLKLQATWLGPQTPGVLVGLRF